jgi:rare lipoprotein A
LTLRRAVAASGAAVALFLACAHPATRPGRSRGGVESGVASYYAESFEGQLTASGTRYHGKRMTCAHRSYPFGSVLRVTAVESGKSVLVEVTDRGPFAPGRLLDLSLAAARALGLLERGLARVQVERVR